MLVSVSHLESRLRNREAVVAVIGLGYVGLTHAVDFARAGFTVYGVDQDAAKVRQVLQGKNYVNGDHERLIELVAEGRLHAATDYDVLELADVILICVPTPLNRHREPDITCVRAATEQVAAHLRPGQLVVLESTTFPGTTEEVVLPCLSATGLIVGKDFYLAFSPERLDPGNGKFQVENTPKIVGGCTAECTRLATTLYQSVTSAVHPASSPRVAEMAKLLENIFRCVNVALVNELALLSRRMEINIWEVIELAATKPYGFMPFYPGPGIGGHCIPIDPFYLTWKARAYDFNTRFVELAGEINTQMPVEVVNLTAEALGHLRKSMRGSRVLILGVAYKPDVPDVRESPAIKIIELLLKRGAHVHYNDDLVPTLHVGDGEMRSVPIHDIRSYDCVVIVTHHSRYDFEQIVAEAKLVVDTRNATRAGHQDHVFVL